MLSKYPNLKVLLVFVFVLIYLSPYLIVKIHPTLDGCAHVYNSLLLKSLLIGNDFLANHLQINTIFLPNVLGHFIMIILSLMFSPIYIEQIFQILLVLLTWHSFNKLISRFNSDNLILSILILPFTYSFLLILGFYNFLIGIPFLLYGIYYFLKLNRNSTFKNYSIIFVFNILCFFSHLFVSASFLLVQILLIALDKEIRDTLSKKLLILVNAVPIILIINYLFRTHIPNKTYTYLTKSELYEWIFNLRSLVTFNPDYELTYTRILAISILGLTMALFTIQLSNYNSLISLIAKLKWLIISSVFLILLFYFPDSDQLSGYYSSRFCFVFFIFLLVFIANYNWHKFVQVFIIIAVSLGSVKLYQDYTFTNDLSAFAKEINDASKLIDNNSYVHTLNLSDNWMHGHFTNFLGLDKNIILDENYEASQSYFPLKWKTTPAKLNTSCDNLNVLPNCHNYLLVLKGNDELKNACIEKIKFVNNSSINILINSGSILLVKIN